MLLQPFIEPLCQRHFTLLCELHALESFDILPKLGCQFLLGVCVDVAENGVALFLVTNDDAALLAAILPLADHAVAGRSSLCHCKFHLRGFYL